jgi:type IV pilus assembly protein PilV
MFMTAGATANLRQSGFTLLEVLITIIILAFGLLALANLQAKMHVTEMESYQRAQAVLLMHDMAARLYNNRGAGGLNAAKYVTADPLGTGDNTFKEVADGDKTCDDVAAGDYVVRDKCEWSMSLLGAAETDKDANKIGAMIDARGCIDQITAPSNVDGACSPGVYRVTVVWAGVSNTVTPDLSCAKDLFSEENQERRRAISTVISIGVPGCV